MPMEVIDQVNRICQAQGQPSLITFQDRHGHYVGDTDPAFAGVLPQLAGVFHDNNDDDIGPDDDNIGTNPPDNIVIDPPDTTPFEHEDPRELEDEQPLTVNNEPTAVNPITSTSNKTIDNPSNRVFDDPTVLLACQRLRAILLGKTLPLYGSHYLEPQLHLCNHPPRYPHFPQLRS